MSQTKKLTITATIGATPEKIWECWTDPKHITGWNFAIDDWQCPWAENDLRPGGKYKARMEAKDGSFGFEFEATYDEVKHLEKITYTMADGRTATTTFTSGPAGVEVQTVFDAEEQNALEMQQNGWQAILNNFKKYVEKGA